ncbi:hypothetical protein H310_06197 [Aphanomyces invadans]|uniref:RNase NYN domain-containing protein n=1 Tax=Aphanomyces invadans TaxID=157072 RepID=A0A024U6M7_9STRA|nr:hypothetical protein H310_06197 [Aphanomyces invadans]ETW01542.1 hypothetical protein H310_06197 [Aphanomyces invadans]|eukprot:XP_008869390.1 hypothetical protein H310_06197 [Aphanomyces invadans]
MVAQPLVVLDAANVATVVRGAVRIQRLQSAIDHFERVGVRCIAFAPGYWTKSKAVTPRGRQQQSAEMELDQKSEMALVQQLVLAEKVVLTPPQAHDDLFIIDYAMKHDGFVLTNDMFRDHVANKMQFHGKELTEAWVKSNCITFAFVGTEFLPSAQHMQALLRPKHPLPKTVDVTSSPRSKAVEGSPRLSTNSMATKPGLTKKTPLPAAPSGRSSSPRAKSPASSRDNSTTKMSDTRTTAARLTIITSHSQPQPPDDELSFEEEVRTSLHPSTTEQAPQKHQRTAKTPVQSRVSTPRHSTPPKSNNMYNSLDETSASSDDDKAHRSKKHASQHEEPHESRPNILNDWNALQSIIAKCNLPAVAVRSTNNQEDDISVTHPNPNQTAVVATKVLTPSQKKRGRRRANLKKQAAAAMVYRAQLEWEYSVLSHPCEDMVL